MRKSSGRSDGRRNDGIRKSVLRQLAALNDMSMDQLREKWRELFGNEPPGYQKGFMLRRLAYRIQELFYGGLSPEAKERLRDIARHDPAATLAGTIPDARKPDKEPLPGTRFIRVWNGKQHEVVASANGFEYDGRRFGSLSAVAREITGTRWNGKVFFGLKKSAASRPAAVTSEDSAHA